MQSSNWVTFETESHFSLALTLKRLERKCTWWHEDSTPKLTKSCIYTQFSVVLFEDAWCMICNSSELIPPRPLLWTTSVSKFSALSPRFFQNSKDSIQISIVGIKNKIIWDRYAISVNDFNWAFHAVMINLKRY